VLDPNSKLDAPIPLKDTSPCGISFEFVKAGALHRPGPPLAFKASRLENSDDEYGNPKGLTPKEMALLDAVGPAPAGGVRIIYVMDMGGGNGYTYGERQLKLILEKSRENGRLPPNRTNEELLAAWKNNIMISNRAGSDTVAHELGHALGLPHVTQSDIERIKDQIEKETVEKKKREKEKELEKAEKNLMLDGGNGDGVLDEIQCGRARGGYGNFFKK
jgi:hypothetical protein